MIVRERESRGDNILSKTLMSHSFYEIQKSECYKLTREYHICIPHKISKN